VIIFPHVIFDPTEPYNWRQAELYERRREVNPKTAVCPLAPPHKKKNTKISPITRNQTKMAITKEQLDQLINSLKVGTKHFTHCPARFDGSRNREVYRQSENISDANTILGLPLLLQGPSYTWWTGVKSSVTTWADAVDAIRSEYAPKRPAYQIYLGDILKPPRRSHTHGTFRFAKTSTSCYKVLFSMGFL
jgi:hypothetical protein